MQLTPMLLALDTWQHFMLLLFRLFGVSASDRCNIYCAKQLLL